MNIVACDIGGTAIKGALFINQKIVRQVSKPTDQHKGKDHTLSVLFKVIDELIDETVLRIGIVSAGAIDPNTGMIVGNTGTMSDWIGFSITEEVENHYQRPCFVDNDANGAMIAEMTHHLQHHIRYAVMLTLGTGVGTAAFIDGELYRGSTNQVEFGHIILVPNGHLCTCGMHGCAEQYLSGSALLKSLRTRIDASITHGSVVFDLYKEGHQEAIAIVEEYIDYLLLYLHSLNRVFDPEIFIIGGGVSTSKDVFVERLLEKQKNTQMHKPVYIARYLNTAGIMGAYQIALKG